MLAVVLSLVSSVAYGVSDFLGGLAARMRPVALATAVAYLFALATLVVVVLVLPGAWSWQGVIAGAVAGVFAAIGLALFYAALAIGPVSLLSPAIAAVQAVVTVAVGILLGESLSPLGYVGVVLAIAAGGLVARPARREGGSRVSLRGGVLALASGLCLGGALVALDAAPADAGQTPSLVEIAIGALLLWKLLLLARWWRPVRRMLAALDEAPTASDAAAASAVASARGRFVPVAAGCGILLAGANALLLAALQSGDLAVVGVLGGLYPIVTAALAWTLLRERVAPHQLAGVACAIAAAVLLGL